MYPILVIPYFLAFILAGFLSSSYLIVWCFRRKGIRDRGCDKWSIGLVAICTVWCAPPLLWFLNSPLSTCSNKIVYSYPQSKSKGGVWEPFWCSRRCEDSSLVVAMNESHAAAVVRDAKKGVRAVGGGHSSNELQCSDDGGTILVVGEEMCELGEVKGGRATFGAGCTVETVLKYLLPLGYQLNGFGAIAQQTIGGSLSTSLHGQHTVSFSDHLLGMRAILANGSVVDVYDDLVHAWKGSMGRLGIVVKATLKVYPLEFVECDSKVEGEKGLLDSLTDPLLSGFEGKRLLTRETYTVRRCYDVPPPLTPVDYENKNSYLQGFVVDNVGIPLIMLLGSLFRDTDLYSRIMLHVSDVASSREGVVPAVNDYRVYLSYNPHYDEEYSIPIRKCHSTLNEIRDAFPDINIHAYLRRVDADKAWLSWAATSSCAVRLEYYDYNREDFVERERIFRMRVEEIVVSNGGGGHRGKIWYSLASELIKNSPKLNEFEEYRRRIDPSSKFENQYTSEMVLKSQRSYSSLPFSLQSRASLWRASVWTCVAVNSLVAISLILLLGKRVRVTSPSQKRAPFQSPPPRRRRRHGDARRREEDARRGRR